MRAEAAKNIRPSSESIIVQSSVYSFKTGPDAVCPFSK